jgi:CheY-like chemotaxis protein
MHEEYSASEERIPEQEAILEEPLEEISGLEEAAEENVVAAGEVLIVDDDSDTLFTISEIVMSCECKTILAQSGAECLEILEETVPDLILLDIMMPGMDGFQTLQKIKTNSKWSHIPVFAVTAKAMAEDKEIIMKHGFDDYIPKPVNAVTMAFKIEKLLTTKTELKK